MQHSDSFTRGKLLRREQLYSGKIVDLIVDRIELNGVETVREVVRHPGGVVVLGELSDGLIPFVRQLRYPIDEPLLELPAGKVDLGEDPAVSAAREMEEETGYRPLSMQLVGQFYATPGFCDELLSCYYSNQLERTETNRESDEEIVLEFHTLEKAIELAVSGEIRDAKTMVALFWLFWFKHQQEEG